MDPFQLIQDATGSSGWMPAEGLDALRKALDSGGYGTDMAGLTGGAAMRIQSLDHVMQTTIQENRHFKLFNRLPKPPAGATVDEWTEQSSVGGFLGGSTNSESGVIADATGAYARRVGMVKFLMTKRSVTFVQSLVTAIADSEAVEYANGALQLLTDAEFLAFEGDSAVVPTEFDGIKAQMLAGVSAGQVDPGSIVDARAGALTSINAINAAAAQISGFGNFGVPSDLFCSLQVQADFDNGLDPAFRVPLNDVPNGGISLGAPVVGIRTSHGPIANQPDVFIRDGNMQLPFEVTYAATAVANAALKPATITVTAAADGTGASQWTAPQAGLYYWAVAGVTAAGQSQVLVSAQATMAAGQKATVVIAQSTGGTETGYVLYRGRLNGTNAVADLRQMVRIPKAGATTTYVDFNQNIPGTTNAFVLNLTASSHAMTWRQLLPMVKFPLYPNVSAIIPWAQMLFGYLRISKRKHHVVIVNILPNLATWKPFG